MLPRVILGAAWEAGLAKDSSKPAGALQPQRNALTGLVSPQLDLIGPTVDDDIRRAIWRYGAEAVKAAVKEATKAKRGRKREPDWPELRDVINADALEWLAGGDPFAARSNYAIAKDFAERNPGHSIVSTHKRVERKLSKGPFDRRWFTLMMAENISRDGSPYVAHLRVLQALAEMPEGTRPQVWQESLDRARATVADYQVREGHPPPADMPFSEIEEAVKKAGVATAQRGGLLSFQPQRIGLLSSILRDSEVSTPE